MIFLKLSKRKVNYFNHIFLPAFFEKLLDDIIKKYESAVNLEIIFDIIYFNRLNLNIILYV